MAKALLDAGAQPNKRDGNGQTPLQIAEMWDKCGIANKNVVQALLDGGADPEFAASKPVNSQSLLT